MKKRNKTEKRKGLLGTKERKLTVGLGLFIMLIMVASVLNLYERPDKENTYEYKGIEFQNTENGWVGRLDNGKVISLMTSPRELENITIERIPFSLLNTMQKIYLSTNPQDYNRDALSELQKLPVTPRIVPACYEDNKQCAEYPLKTCNDTTETIGVILLKESNVTEVSFKYNCLTIQGEELGKLVDKIILQQV